MITMNVDAMRRAMDDTRAGKLTDATALIQQTLGQHGLLDGFLRDILAKRPVATTHSKRDRPSDVRMRGRVA